MKCVRCCHRQVAGSAVRMSVHALLVVLALIGFGLLHFEYVTFGMTCLVTAVALVVLAIVITIFDL